MKPASAKEALKLTHERLLIDSPTRMKPFTWLWVSRVPGQAAAIRTHAWHKGQSGESLRQKRAQIVFTLDEEEALDFYTVPVRLRDAFDRDKISRSFYE